MKLTTLPLRVISPEGSCADSILVDQYSSQIDCLTIPSTDFVTLPKADDLLVSVPELGFWTKTGSWITDRFPDLSVGSFVSPNAILNKALTLVGPAKEITKRGSALAGASFYALHNRGLFLQIKILKHADRKRVVDEALDSISLYGLKALPALSKMVRHDNLNTNVGYYRSYYVIVELLLIVMQNDDWSEWHDVIADALKKVIYDGHAEYVTSAGKLLSRLPEGQRTIKAIIEELKELRDGMVVPLFDDGLYRRTVSKYNERIDALCLSLNKQSPFHEDLTDRLYPDSMSLERRFLLSDF